jgi:Na+-transporting methylmalonyl-CoA/oxaloacetate decarboxylase gamma subunit
MNPTTLELLRQGLIMTVIGMGLVFAALALLWGVMVLLTRIFRPAAAGVGPPPGEGAGLAAADSSQTESAAREALTAERARVAAAVAGALMANAIPLPVIVPTGPTFEHGRTAPIWVAANRARALHSWQPPRAAESRQPTD